MKDKRKINILECTLRDGSYAIDFRFTLQDTALLAKVLSGLGFEYIEVGHGLGINAAEAGKGAMPATDAELLEAAKSSAPGARIGMFCIPGIAELDHVSAMAEGGMDFIRIGNDADTIEKAFPFIERARKKGMKPMLNFMKSYAISATEFGERSRQAAEHGAEAIYLVDSTGGMLPSEVEEYLGAVRERVDIEMGFHGHNNLHLATANALKAVECGATFVDTTLYGLGRSAGNAPTEVMVSVLDNMGIETGIDLLDLMDVAEAYFSPLTSRIRMYDMMSVVMGAAKFHSSFFPVVKKAASEHGADVRRLVYTMGRKDPLHIDPDALEAAALELRGGFEPEESHEITGFYSAKLHSGMISNTMKSVTALLEGLMDVSAKGRRAVVIEITPSLDPEEGHVMAEYITSDSEMALGRVHVGNQEVLDEVLSFIGKYTSFVLIDLEAVSGWMTPDGLASAVSAGLEGMEVLFYGSRSLMHTHIEETLRLLRGRNAAENLLVVSPAGGVAPILYGLSPVFSHVLLYSPVAADKKAVPPCDNCSAVKLPEDWKNLDLEVDTVLFAVAVSREDLGNVMRGVKSGSTLLYTEASFPSDLESVADPSAFGLLRLDPAEAYHGRLGQWLRAAGVMDEMDKGIIK